MQMDIQRQGFVLTAGINNYVIRRLGFGLSYGDGVISRVNVRLSEINRPRGGGGKRCLIEVWLKGVPSVVIENVEADIYLTIDRAAGRASRTLARRLSRQRQFGRGLPAGYPDAQEASI